MISLFFAASFTFTATATGLEKGAPVEFFFAGKGSDRDYETLFILDQSVTSFREGLEKAGFPRGKATSASSCVLWPVGATVTLKPGLDEFVKTQMPDGLDLGSIIYTGGSRTEKGDSRAESEQPFSVFALYTLPQSLLQFNGIYPQGIVYNCHLVKQALKKGEKRTFTLTWDDKTRPQPLALTFTTSNVVANLTHLKALSAKSEIDLLATFSDELTVQEATAIAHALSTIDSREIKVNGRPEHDFFYRSFEPLVKWRDRKERLQQPFEVTIKDGEPTIIYLDEDWSGEGLDPMLTEKKISVSELSNYPKTDTCFIFTYKTTRLNVLKDFLKKLPQTVRNIYVYGDDA